MDRAFGRGHNHAFQFHPRPAHADDPAQPPAECRTRHRRHGIRPQPSRHYGKRGAPSRTVARNRRGTHMRPAFAAAQPLGVRLGRAHGRFHNPVAHAASERHDRGRAGSHAGHRPPESTCRKYTARSCGINIGGASAFLLPAPARNRARASVLRFLHLAFYSPETSVQVAIPPACPCARFSAAAATCFPWECT